MSTEIADDVGAELAHLYDEWNAANAAAAALLKERTAGAPLSSDRRARLETLEAHIASLALRYRALGNANPNGVKAQTPPGPQSGG